MITHQTGGKDDPVWQLDLIFTHLFKPKRMVKGNCTQGCLTIKLDNIGRCIETTIKKSPTDAMTHPIGMHDELADMTNASDARHAMIITAPAPCPNQHTVINLSHIKLA